MKPPFCTQRKTIKTLIFEAGEMAKLVGLIN